MLGERLLVGLHRGGQLAGLGQRGALARERLGDQLEVGAQLAPALHCRIAVLHRLAVVALLQVHSRPAVAPRAVKDMQRRSVHTS